MCSNPINQESNEELYNMNYSHGDIGFNTSSLQNPSAENYL